MTNKSVARDTVRRAQRVLSEARRLAEGGAWNLVVRRSQEAVELALKGLLRFAGLEVPHIDDVGGLLKRSTERLSEGVQPHLPMIVSISRRLVEEREISFYGDERTDTAPEALYNQEDGDDALADASFVVELCPALVDTPRVER